MSEALDSLAARIEERLGDTLTRVPSVCRELSYEVPAAELVSVCRTLRDDDQLGFELLIDACGVDYLNYGRAEWETEEATDSGFSRAAEREPEPGRAIEPGRRFAVVYHLLSVSHNRRLRLKVFAPDDAAPIVDTVTDIWRSADWYEREAFDLFGILFRGHADLRRILTDYGFIGHPFRKDFPLIGNVEVRYDPDKGRVVYQPVSIEPRTLVPRVIRGDNRYQDSLKGDLPGDG